MPTPYLILLEALRVSCGLPEFPDPLPSTEMDLELENGPTISIDFKKETDVVEIFSQIGTYAPHRELEVVKKIAEDNFLWTATAGGTLSARPETQTVYLAHQVPVLSLNESAFIHLVEKFVEIVGQWQKFLSDDELPSSATSSAEKLPAEEMHTAPPMPGSGNFIIG